jgi:hypothetical protein
MTVGRGEGTMAIGDALDITTMQLAPPPGEDGAPLPVLEAEYVRYVDALVRSAAADQR